MNIHVPTVHPWRTQRILRKWGNPPTITPAYFMQFTSPSHNHPECELVRKRKKKSTDEQWRKKHRMPNSQLRLAAAKASKDWKWKPVNDAPHKLGQPHSKPVTQKWKECKKDKAWTEITQHVPLMKAANELTERISTCWPTPIHTQPSLHSHHFLAPISLHDHFPSMQYTIT